MGGCSGITHATVTKEMIEEFPELQTEKQISAGEEITIGFTPFDGKVRGPTRHSCGENSCKINTPIIDGNKPASWENTFVQKYLPHELANLEDAREGIPEATCYSNPLRKLVGMEVMHNKNFSRTKHQALVNFEDENASIGDLRAIAEALNQRLEEARAGNENTTPINFAIKYVSMQIKVAEQMAEK